MGLFDDMLSSARGPGLIGSLIAMTVLVGFSGLYFLVYDDPVKKSIGSIIEDESKTLARLQNNIEIRRKEADILPGRLATQAEVETLAQKKEANEGEIQNLTDSVAKTAEELQATEEAFVSYRQDYRNQIRASAKGTTYEEIRTSNGRIFKNVTVSSVDAVGMSFLYQEGTSRAAFEHLPPAIQEQFQYDPNEQEEAKRQELLAARAHGNRVNTALAAKAEVEEQRAQARLAQMRERNAAELVNLQNAVLEIDRQIAQTKAAWSFDQSRKRGVVDSARYSKQISDLSAQRVSHLKRMAELRKTLE